MSSRYDAVLAALDAGVVVHAADTQILDANDRARELLGIKDLEGRMVSDPAWAFLEADGTPIPGGPGPHDGRTAATVRGNHPAS